MAKIYFTAGATLRDMGCTRRNWLRHAAGALAAAQLVPAAEEVQTPHRLRRPLMAVHERTLDLLGGGTVGVVFAMAFISSAQVGLEGSRGLGLIGLSPFAGLMSAMLAASTRNF